MPSSAVASALLPALAQDAEVHLDAHDDEQQDDRDRRVGPDASTRPGPEKSHACAPGAMRPRTVGPSRTPAAISPTTSGSPSARPISPSRRAVPSRIASASRNATMSWSVKGPRSRRGTNSYPCWGLIVAALCIALNGFFVAAEFALVKVRATQPALSRPQRREEGAPRRVHRAEAGPLPVGDPVRDHARQPRPRVDRRARDGAACSTAGRRRWAGAPSARTVQVVVTAVAFAILTFAHVLFGELVPKLLAIQRSEGTALASAIPLRVVYVTFWPLLWLLERSSRVILRALGMSPDVGSVEGRFSEEEIVAILAASACAVAAGQGGGGALRARDALLEPRRAPLDGAAGRRGVAPVQTSGEEAQRFVRSHQYSRLLLTNGRSLDDVAGYLYAKDFLLHPDAATRWPT